MLVNIHSQITEWVTLAHCGYVGVQRQEAGSSGKPHWRDGELAPIFTRFCFFLIPR